MYKWAKNIILSLGNAREPLSSYAISKDIEKEYTGSSLRSSISYEVNKLRDHGLIHTWDNDNNELTDLGSHLFDFIIDYKRRVNESESPMNEKEAIKRFGEDAIKKGKELKILSLRDSRELVVQIVDPDENEFINQELKNQEASLAHMVGNAVEYLLGFCFRPASVLFRPELSLDTKGQLLSDWYWKDYWVAVNGILGTSPVWGTALIIGLSELSKGR